MIIKKSRFITHLARVDTVLKAENFIQQIKKQEATATHNCSAYLIGKRNQYQHANDNGEPSGTAGVPMLQTLQQMQVQNVVAVVTRYFGGIKLGSGGLIRAYRNSVSQAINAVGRVRGIPKQELIITINYKQLDILQYWLQQEQLPLQHISYTEHVTVTTLVSSNQVSTVKTTLNNLFHAQLPIKLGTTTFQEVPLASD